MRKNFTSPKKLTEEEIQQIIERFCALDVCDLSLRQAFYKVLDESKQYFCSVATLYRIFRERNLLGKRTPTRSARRCTRPTSYQADKPNVVWTWDITYLRRSGCTGQFLYAYVIVDLFSRMIISARVFEADNADYAVRFLREAFNRYSIKPGQLVLHSDNGASMKAAKTLALLASHGITSSRSRPRVSNDNPFSESLFRTLKYSGQYRYPRNGFESCATAQAWLDGFVEFYNEQERHSGIRMVTPGSRYRGEDTVILRERAEIIHKARQKNPERWIQGKTMNCDPIAVAWLNPENGQLESGSVTV